MAFEEIRDYFARHVLGRVRVRGTGALALAAPRASSHRRPVETHPFRTQMRIHSPAILSFRDGLQCSSGGFRFSRTLVRVKGERPRRYAPGEIRAKGLSLFRAHEVRDGLKTILTLPQERPNRLKWQHPPKAADEMFLAWYGPIVEGAVVKLSLNRQKGTLLIWYNPQSRQCRARGVYLYRRASAGSKPEWRWV